MIPFWKKSDKNIEPPSAPTRRKKVKPAVPRTAQQSIPFQRMFEDGTCRVRSGYYTRTIQFQDINYQLAQQEDKTAIFEEWCSFLNFFDSSIRFELSFMDLSTDTESFERSICIPFQRDGFDDVRAEYSQMLRQQLAKGNNGLTKTKFLTFGIHGDSMRQVKPRLEHIQNDLLNNFHRLGVLAQPLNGAQRLKLMHDMFHMDGPSRFCFDWKDLAPSGLTVKDAIAPTAFAFKTSRTFQMGGIFGAVSFLSITASDLSDQLLKDLLDMDSSQIATMHIQSVDQNKAIKTVKRTITELDRSKIEEQKKAIRAGYDMDILPSDLATYGRDAKALLKELQSQNERMFLVTFLVLNTGRTEQELENNVFQASSIAQKHNCSLCRLDYQQEQGLMSSLPLADNQIEIQRGLTTSSTAIFIPFTTQELYQSGKESLYYGLNSLSQNLIMVDRKKLKNPNGLILGTPGSGKSFSAKREITNAFLVTEDDIIICDPEAEYSPLVQRLKGQVIKISPNSTQFINPMDINSNYSEEENPLALKADFILSLCELVVGGKEGLLPVEKTVIDRCVHLIYRRYFADPRPENMPLLEDLYEALLQQEEKEAHHVATALEIYVKGSLNLFNHRTNVDVNNRIVCYDIKELGKQMKKIGMLVVQDQVWGRVTANRSAGRSTRYYVDEFHLLLKEEQTAAYSVEIWKRFRKWGGIPTGLTQNVKDLLSAREVENIFENSDFVYMLNQAAGDRQILAKQLNISPHQLSYVTHSGEGEGLLFFGNVILPFVDRFPQELELYRIMTTKLGEVSEGGQK
ncbi:MAG: VirB4-like conjugal transfer ATPase, CD1110 family [Faecalibacterium sp.]